MPSSHKCPECGRECDCEKGNKTRNYYGNIGIFPRCDHDCEADAQWRADEHIEGLIDEETERRIENASLPD
jgi:hypothetical protein